MFPLVCLGLGLILAIAGRIMLFVAALGVSIWWALGIFLPFGPLFFRLQYPDLARSSTMVRLFGVFCLAIFLFNGIVPGRLNFKHHFPQSLADAPAPFFHYSFEKESKESLEQRWAANAKEFERLAQWNEALRLRKRDLLNSDIQGNEAYNIDLAEYHTALAKATAEKNALSRARAQK
jgi:hypothetical protein